MAATLRRIKNQLFHMGMSTLPRLAANALVPIFVGPLEAAQKEKLQMDNNLVAHQAHKPAFAT